MLLQKLVEYSERLERKGEIAPIGYNYKPVRYRIELTKKGELRNPVLLNWTSDEEPYGAVRAVPDNGRTSNTAARLLADDMRYTFGVSTGSKAKVAKYHADYMKLLQRLVGEVDNDSVAAVLTFLQNQPLTNLQLPNDVDEKAIICFQVENVFPHELPEVQAFWMRNHAELVGEARCMVCGELKQSLRVLPFQIKGIPKSQQNSAAIVSANQPAYYSYGLEQAQTAPMCMRCSDRFTKAANSLISEPTSSIVLQGLVFIFWTREETRNNLFQMLSQPNPRQVAELLKSVFSGKRQPERDEMSFYAVSLSATSSRVVIRDWIDTTIGEVNRALAQWFRRHEIVDEWGDLDKRLGVYQLAKALVPLKKKKRDMSKLMIPDVQALLHTALNGTPLSSSLLQRALRLNAKEGNVTHERAALTKLILTSQSIIQENHMVQLDANRPEPAYQCGRLLYVLENIQRSALGKLNTTVTDQFYGSASSAPDYVFGMLVHRAKYHISKMRRSGNEGTAIALENQLTEVLNRFPNYPSTLNVREQALFSLGYYHQRAYEFAQIEARKAAKKKMTRTPSSAS